jgi:hypothetical protein
VFEMTDSGFVAATSAPPSIAAPTAATVGVGQAGAISGVSISESNTTAGETFTVTLADSNGLLTATGSGVSGSGTTSRSISGSLAQVSSDLATLGDTDGTAGSDTITINASDSNGGTATPASIAVTVNGLPTIAVPTTAAVAQNQASAISGLSLSESGDTAGESFTVTLSDANGDLSATGTGVSGSGTTSLTISGSLRQVNADLATLTDTDAGAFGADDLRLVRDQRLCERRERHRRSDARRDYRGGQPGQGLSQRLDEPGLHGDGGRVGQLERDARHACERKLQLHGDGD